MLNIDYHRMAVFPLLEEVAQQCRILQTFASTHTSPTWMS